MTDTQQSQSRNGSLSRDLLYALRYYFGNRRALLVLAGLVIGTGLALNWSWLAAVGIAPILISLLPCLAMCALGLCMNRSGSKSCSTAESNAGPTEIEEAGPVTKAIAIDTTPDSIAPKIDDARVHAGHEPQPSNERRPNDA
ncbi:hypothetical protein [Labrenzia sp. CP4]|jgi:hypothetical protein|uniref:hypothetical protein n=1 Tax=Labrenzia sp. CP4 TaxID=1674922 RepID=UPI0009EE177E|nr:hypothetical protein [Labrenzia sp. CP4]